MSEVPTAPMPVSALPNPGTLPPAPQPFINATTSSTTTPSNLPAFVSVPTPAAPPSNGSSQQQPAMGPPPALPAQTPAQFSLINNQMFAVATAASGFLQAEAPQPAAPRPTYVNHKQYERILKRREARARLEEYYRLRRAKEKERKPYMHESRHRHAMKRPRDSGGRFLTKAQLVDYYKEHPELDPRNQPDYVEEPKRKRQS